MSQKKILHSKRQIFMAAAVGSFAPQILRWHSQGGISVPDETLAQMLGWLTVTTAFTLLAGYVASDIWGETDLRRAFFIGIGIPSIILSGGADLANSLTPAKAHGQTNGRQALGIVEVQVVDSGGSLVPNATVSVKGPTQNFSQRPSTSATFHVASGTYAVVAEAPGFQTQTKYGVTVQPRNRTAVRIVLPKRSFAQDFFRGVRRPFERRR